MKFTRPFVRPFIVVDCKIVSGSMLTEINPKFHNKKFYCISVSDNGIGFEKQFNAKMFQIFQRLHHYESAFDGKGIGLAICQRIMANHEGYISAEGEPDKGATFKLFFPVEE